jgi:CRP-like cAMP-binding protein
VITAEELIAAWSRYVDLNLEEANALIALWDEQHFPKKSFLIEQGGKADAFFWVRSGCLIAYHTDDKAQEQVIQFAVANWWSTDLAAFTLNKEAEYAVQALADSTVYALCRDDYHALLLKYPVFERYFRQIFNNALIAHQRRIYNALAATAEERYNRFIKQYPEIELWVPQKYIASYLGMTPEFLSKLRRRRWEKRE